MDQHTAFDEYEADTFAVRAFADSDTDSDTDTDADADNHDQDQDHYHNDNSAVVAARPVDGSPMHGSPMLMDEDEAFRLGAKVRSSLVLDYFRPSCTATAFKHAIAASACGTAAAPSPPSRFLRHTDPHPAPPPP